MSIQSITEQCIACLSPNRVLTSTNESLAGRTIAEMLKTLVSSFVFIDEMPSNICMLCKNNLILAYDFRQMLVQSEIQIREILTNNSNVEAKVECLEENFIENDNAENEDQVIDEEKQVSVAAGKVKVVHKCDICEKIFSRASHLKRHAIVHTRERKKRLKKRNISRKKEKNVICSVCEKGFVSKDSLRKHLILHENGYSCKYCEKTFKIKAELQTHVTSEHKEITQHSCPHCSKAFSANYLLKEHIRSHDPEFLCPICGRAFHRSSTLRHHVYLHNAEKKFVCNYCGTKFATRNGLKSHLLSHTGEKKFVCETCNKPFAKSDGLTKHRRLHTGQTHNMCRFEAYATNFTRKWSEYYYR